MGFKNQNPTKDFYAGLRSGRFFCLRFYVLKPRCSEAEQKAWARIPCGTLFERPNVPGKKKVSSATNI
jgi:hypothetical protein